MPRAEKKAAPKKSDAITQHDGMPIVMENAVVLHVFGLGPRDAGVISISTYKEKTSLDIRRFYPSDEREWRPTSRGIKIPADTVEEVLDALEAKRSQISDLIR